MSQSISETFSGNREPQWLVESRKEPQSHFDCRGCVRQIRRSNVHTPPGRDYERTTSRGRQAYVYTGAPATVHTVVDHRPAAPFTTMNTTVNIPIVEFMVPLCCGKCEEKVEEELENVEGVYKVVCDQHNQRVTVTSTLDPHRLLKRVRRIKKDSHFWSLGAGSTYHVASSQHYHVSPTRSSYDPQYTKRKADYYAAGGENQLRSYHVSPTRASYDPAQTQYTKRKGDYYAPMPGRITLPYGGYTSTGTPYMESYGHLPYEDYVEYY